MAEVTKEAFDSCSANNMISLHLNGPARIRLNTTSKHYFICMFNGHCSARQKLAISIKPDEDAVSPSGSVVPPQTPISTQLPTSKPGGPFEIFSVGGDTSDANVVKLSNDGRLMLLTTMDGHIHVLDSFYGRLPYIQHRRDSHGNTLVLFDIERGLLGMEMRDVVVCPSNRRVRSQASGMRLFNLSNRRVRTPTSKMMLDQGNCKDFKACNTATFLKEFLLSALQESANILKDTMKETTLPFFVLGSAMAERHQPQQQQLPHNSLNNKDINSNLPQRRRP
ncbi:hypothetical protein Sjap_023733 [Stephania japonica]|uniref:Phytocyanin domain-containing protein n=1 Tax=Stephania japonica TaxID=461633 RepID=A0AAP0HN92_9MAGN